MLLGAKGQKSGTSSLDTKLTTAAKIKALTKEIRRWTSFPHLSLLIVQHSLKKKLEFPLDKQLSNFAFPGQVLKHFFLSWQMTCLGGFSENEKSPMPKENLFVPDDRINTFCTQLCNSYTHDPSL